MIVIAQDNTALSKLEIQIAEVAITEPMYLR